MRIHRVAFGLLVVGCGGAQTKGATQPPAPVASVVAPVPAKPAAPSEDDAPVPVGKDDPTWGRRDALVTIVEFSDFQCPFCARAEETLERLKAQYGPERLRVVFKEMPLPFHDNARSAAEAAEGVHALGGDDTFWAFHHRAFSAQNELGVDSYVRWASDVHVDPLALRRGLETHQWAAKVDADMALAKRLGVNGTPAFFINGTAMSGAQPVSRFTDIIDDEIQKAQRAIERGTPRDRVYVAMTTENVKNAPPPEDDEDAPDTHVWKIPVAGAPVRGANTALVTIVEYSDFQCPYCKKVEPTLEQLRTKYGNDVRIVWKNEPLPFHPRALPAAELALEARAQKGDKGFWDAHDRLFAAQPKLEDDDLAQIAKEMGLDVAKVKDAIAKKSHAKAIEHDQDEADDFGATGTPHFFVNGRRLVGAQPLEAFTALVDEELTKARALVAQGIAPAAVYTAATKDGNGPPDPPRLDLAVPADAPSRGSASAKVVIQEFGDFQCPYTKRVEPTVDQLLKDYAGKVRVVWRNLPLPNHPEAPGAARAALETYAQKGSNGFAKMQELLFANQPNGGLRREAIDGYARDLGLDMPRYTQAMDGGAHQTAIDLDAKAAAGVGIHGTPVFLINGYVLTGAQPYAKFRRLVDRAIADTAGAKKK